MSRTTLRSIVTAAFVAPALLALSACGESTETGDLSGEPIAEIPAPDGQVWSDVIEETEGGGFRMGNPDAPIKLMEFASLTCPACAAFSQGSDAELKSRFVDSGRVSFEFRNFTLNPLDLTMAMLTQCGPDEAFFALTSQTFANQQTLVQSWSNADPAMIQQAAEQPPETRYLAIAQLAGLTDFYAARGIATDQARACLADPAAAEALVERAAKDSEDFDIQGTPTFVINGQKVDSVSWDEIKARLEGMGAR